MPPSIGVHRHSGLVVWESYSSPLPSFRLWWAVVVWKSLPLKLPDPCVQRCIRDYQRWPNGFGLSIWDWLSPAYWLSMPQVWTGSTVSIMRWQPPLREVLLPITNQYSTTILQPSTISAYSFSSWQVSTSWCSIWVSSSYVLEYYSKVLNSNCISSSS